MSSGSKPNSVTLEGTAMSYYKPHSKKQTGSGGTDSPNYRKRKRQNDNAYFSSQVDQFAAAVHSHRVSISFNQRGCSFNDCEAVLRLFPGFEQHSDLYLGAIGFLASHENRDAFMALPDDSVRQRWLIRSLSCPHQNFTESPLEDFNCTVSFSMSCRKKPKYDSMEDTATSPYRPPPTNLENKSRGTGSLSSGERETKNAYECFLSSINRLKDAWQNQVIHVTFDTPGCSFKDCEAILRSISGFEQHSDSYLDAVNFLTSHKKRSIFMALPNNEIRQCWLMGSLSCTQQKIDCRSYNPFNSVEERSSNDIMVKSVIENIKRRKAMAVAIMKVLEDIAELHADEISGSISAE